MRNISLFFELGELIEVTFGDNQGNQRISVRGKTGGPFRAAGSFQWTSAVKALALLLAKTRLNPTAALLRGENASLAASLDYAISKQPSWLTEMFGCDQQGISFARRLILRTNPERKRPGPVTLGINQLFLKADQINIFVEGTPCSDEDLARLIGKLDQLETGLGLAQAA
jgi:hypothetical protein